MLNSNGIISTNNLRTPAAYWHTSRGMISALGRRFDMNILTRKCTKCGEEKSLSEFSKHVKGKYGLRPTCKQCDAAYSSAVWKDPQARAKKEAYAKAYRESPSGSAVRKAHQKAYSARPDVKERTRAHWFRTEYGITLEQYNQMYFDQGGNCAVCGAHYEIRGTNKLDTLHVDHNHETGKVRGLLCHNCNSGIGYFKEDKNLIQRILDYLGGK
jgi:hypothetical protein